MAITPEGSCLEILDKIGGLSASPKSVESISKGIRYAVTMLKNGVIEAPLKSKIGRYSNTYVAREFEILFKQVIND